MTAIPDTIQRSPDQPPPWTRLDAAGARRLGLGFALANVAGYIAIFFVAREELLTIWLMPVVASQITGAVVIARRPAHPIGWLFTWSGVTIMVSLLMYGAVRTAISPGAELPVSPESVPGWVGWADQMADALNTASTGLFIPLTLVLFPNGRLPSRRWRWVAIAAGLAAVIGFTASFLAGGWGGDPSEELVTGPFTGSAAALGVTLSSVFFLLLFSAWIGGAASFLVRFRRTQGVERQQLKLLAFAAAFAITIAFSAFIPVELGGYAELPLAVAFAATPVAAGVAILRYRLYDIDIVIRRSVVVGGLVAFVTGLYIAVVVGVGRLLGTDDAGPLLSITATAVVALAFQPARERLERFANRLVYGRRATPYEILSDFSSKVADTETPDDALGRIADLLADGTGAVRVEVWLRVGDRLRLAAASPDHDLGHQERTLPASDGLPLMGADLAARVVEGGELLGALTLTKPPQEPPTPAEAALLQRVAGQAGLVLRNQRLTAELHNRLDELQDSRHRLVAAADTARQQLEQRLAAATTDRLSTLDAGIAAATTEARAAGATRTVGLLERVTGAIDGARTELAELGAGLYPRELADRGLTVALGHAAQRAAFPVACDLADIGRLPADRELAVWFTALEALQNAAKHAGGSPARLTLRRTDDRVELVVTDAGPGFDPTTTKAGAGLANMRDRLAAFGGHLLVDSAPGAGTTITATVAAETVP